MQQVIFITGASKGIGREIALHLHQQGYIVYGTSRKPMQPADTPFKLVQLDVTDEHSVQQCVEGILNDAGHIDILINNAGYDLYGAVEETTLDELHQQMDTNFYGAVRVIQAVLPQMRHRGKGKIINMSSIGGLMSLPFNSAYAASKYALEGYSETLRYEVMPFGVYVSLVEPGSVNTDTLDTSIIEVAEGHSSYETQRQYMTQQMREFGVTNGISIQQVVSTVDHIVKTSKPRLRYPVGLHARTLPLMKAFLPQWSFERFIRGQFMPQ